MADPYDPDRVRPGPTRTGSRGDAILAAVVFAGMLLSWLRDRIEAMVFAYEHGVAVPVG